MRPLPTALVISLALSAPIGVIAQESNSDIEDGFSLIEEGAKLFLRGLSNEIEPLMKDFATEMEPKLQALSEDLVVILEQFNALVDDFEMYHPPERLPNGDIILRRKTSPDAPDLRQDEPGEIEI